MGIEPMSEAWENCCFNFQIEYRCDYQTLSGTGMRSDHRRSGLRTSETLGGEGTRSVERIRCAQVADCDEAP
jgi:hypothetical protein